MKLHFEKILKFDCDFLNGKYNNFRQFKFVTLKDNRLGNILAFFHEIFFVIGQFYES